MTLLSLSLLGLVGSVAAQTQYTSTGSAAVAAARATALTLSPTSNVAGTKFERYVQIFLENTDYSKAIANSEYRLLPAEHSLTPSTTLADLAYLASLGISLTNYKAITHPSQVCPPLVSANQVLPKSRTLC